MGRGVGIARVRAGELDAYATANMVLNYTIKRGREALW